MVIIKTLVGKETNVSSSKETLKMEFQTIEVLKTINILIVLKIKPSETTITAKQNNITQQKNCFWDIFNICGYT